MLFHEDFPQKDENGKSVIPTRNDFASLSRLEAGEHCTLVVGRVHTSLNALLKHWRRPAWPKVVRELLDTPLVQMGTHFAVLV